MSRTIKGSKAVGYDYWSKRPMNKGGGLVGRFTKKYTVKIEREMKKNEVDKEVEMFFEDEYKGL